MDRESLLAAARVCRDRADVHGQRHAVAFEMEALGCQLAILALAEQEDQRGAAATAGKPEEAVAGETRNGMQSAPHPDPAGQAALSGASTATNAPETGQSGKPALPGPETVSVPRERPCIHEWYQGACVHCELPAGEFRAMLAAGSAK